VLELGAGVGLASLVADVYARPSLLVATDGTEVSVHFSLLCSPNYILIVTSHLPACGLQAVLELTRRNLSRHRAPNEIPPVFVEHLFWGKEHLPSFLESHPNFYDFDVILGCDLVYARTNLTQLFETVQALLAPNGVCVSLSLPSVPFSLIRSITCQLQQSDSFVVPL
jgi:hypothetical protein